MYRLTALFFVFLCGLSAQISSGGVVNIASFAPVGLPNAGIARGSLFTVFGQNLAGDALAQAGEFPLPLTLGGVSIVAEVDRIRRDCPMIFTTAGQLAALLPSDLPAGEGELRVSFGGAAYSEPITVVDRSFGIFAQNQRGSGLSIFQNFVTQADQPVNGPRRPIAQGNVGTLWGVGLGPVTGNEAAGPLPGDLGRDFQIYVGDALVSNILYAGRSGCCAGVDQIVFEIPGDAPAGCYVPITVVLDGIPSNQGAISISSDEACGDFDSFSASEVLSISSDSAFRFARFDVSRIDWTLHGTPLLEEQASATFREFVGGQFLQNPSYLSSGENTCLVRFGTDDPDSQGVTAPFNPISAGDVIPYEIPGGVRQMRLANGAAYVDDIADLVPSGQPTLEPGLYTFMGTDAQSTVGTFQAMVDVGIRSTWSNKAEIELVDRETPLRIRWDPGDPDERVLAFGVSRATNRAGRLIFASFACDAPMAAGELVIPRYVLGALPRSGVTQVPGFGSVREGALQVGSTGIPARFEAVGIDSGFVTHFFSEGILGLDYR